MAGEVSRLAAGAMTWRRLKRAGEAARQARIG